MNKFSKSPKSTDTRFMLLSGSNLPEMEIIGEESFSCDSEQIKTHSQFKNQP